MLVLRRSDEIIFTRFGFSFVTPLQQTRQWPTELPAVNRTGTDTVAAADQSPPLSRVRMSCTSAHVHLGSTLCNLRRPFPKKKRWFHLSSVPAANLEPYRRVPARVLTH